MKARYPILFATFLLVVASLVWILYRTPATIAVPKVAGQTVAEAKEALKKANFEVGEEKQRLVIRLKKVVLFVPILTLVRHAKKEQKLI